MQASFDAVFLARLLVAIGAILHQELRPGAGDALGLSGILVLGINLDEQAIDIGRDAHIGAQLLRRHIHLQGINDLGGAQGAIDISDMVVERLLDGLGQAEVAAAGHDEHLLGGAVDGVHAFAEDEGGAGGDDGEQEHDPAAADEDIGVVDEVHGAILPQPHGGSEKVCRAHTKLQAFSSHEQGGLKKRHKGTE